MALAVIVVFLRPLSPLLDYVRGIERNSGLQLTPALLILAGVFIYQQLRKRMEIRAEAVAAAAELDHARIRANDMERLVTFGHALAEALDADAIRAAVQEHLPLLARERASWVVLCAGEEWEPFVEIGNAPDLAERAASATRAFKTSPFEKTPYAAGCFPMSVGRTPVGALGVMATPPLGDDERQSLEAAAALLAVSIKNAELFRAIRENSVRDQLTGCFNRRHAMEALDAELRRSRRAQSDLSLIIFDLDHFKGVNDRYGHQCGDTVLKAVGRRMHVALRSSDVKCRYGGEEFLVLLPGTPLTGAERVAETLRRELAALSIVWEGTPIPVSASFGVTVASQGELDVDEIIARADAALYRAKEGGRNCIRVEQVPGPVQQV
jgi:diguanylate cyclase (GGDEF)-like protein